MKNALENLQRWIVRWRDRVWQEKLRDGGGHDTEPEVHMAIAIEKMFRGEGFYPRNRDMWEVFNDNVARMLNVRMSELAKIVDELPIKHIEAAQRLIAAEGFRVNWN